MTSARSPWVCPPVKSRCVEQDGFSEGKPFEGVGRPGGGGGGVRATHRNVLPQR